MASVNDWAAKAADRIDNEIRMPSLGSSAKRRPSKERIAAIIATFAEPLVALLRESRREHHHCDDSWYCCPMCESEDHGRLGEGPGHHDRKCTCGAAAWNARVDAALAGEAKEPPETAQDAPGASFPARLRPSRAGGYGRA